jgi:hypothetical protein
MGAGAGACTPTTVLRADCRRDTNASKAPAVSASCARSAATSTLSPADSAASSEAGAGAGAAYCGVTGAGLEDTCEVTHVMWGVRNNCQGCMCQVTKVCSSTAAEVRLAGMGSQQNFFKANLQQPAAG